MLGREKSNGESIEAKELQSRRGQSNEMTDWGKEIPERLVRDFPARPEI